MSFARAVSLAVLGGASCLVVTNGCAFFTCVEDDCATVAAGGSTPTSSGAGGTGGQGPSVTSTTASATNTGAGGGEPCTKHCVSGACTTEACQPVCSQLPGTGYAVTTTANAVYAVTDEAPGTTTIQRVARAGIGDPTTNAGAGGEFTSSGHLASADDSVFFGVESTIRRIEGEVCSTPAMEVKAAASGADRTFWIDASTIQSRKACSPEPPLDLAAPLAIATVGVPSATLVAYSLKEGLVCVTSASDLGYSTPTCFDGSFQDASSLALTPDAKQLLFVHDGGVMIGAIGATTPDVLVAAGSGAIAVAATNQAYFVSRVAPQGEGTLLRCPSGSDPADCRSFGDGTINAIHGAGDAVYFTMGDSLCAWE